MNDCKKCLGLVKGSQASPNSANENHTIMLVRRDIDHWLDPIQSVNIMTDVKR